MFQDGETPLIKATKMRSIEVVELLLDKGAKVSAVDKVSSRKTVCGGPHTFCPPHLSFSVSRKGTLPSTSPSGAGADA